MADRPHSYPPVGDPDRLDAILRRGRFLRRRRQMTIGAGAGSAMAATVAAVVLLTGLPGGGSDDGLVADQPATTTTVAPTSTETTVDEDDTSSTTTTTSPDGLSVDVDATSTPVAVRVDDPAQPVFVTGRPEAHQCLLVTVRDGAGAPVAEGRGCHFANDPTTVVQVLLPQDQAFIGCAAVAERPAPDEVTTAAASSEFRVELPVDLAAGTYDLEVQAASGIGDGCPGPTVPDEHENSGTTTAELVVP